VFDIIVFDVIVFDVIVFDVIVFDVIVFDVIVKTVGGSYRIRISTRSYGYCTLSGRLCVRKCLWNADKTA